MEKENIIFGKSSSNTNEINENKKINENKIINPKNEIIRNTNSFFNEIFSSNKTKVTPITYIIFFSVFSVFFLILLYVFKDKLKYTLLEDKYQFYTILIGINVINIIAILTYYNFKSGTFIGDTGTEGEKGDKGDNGEILSCSLCQHNLYIVKTTIHDNICELNLMDLVKTDITKSEILTANLEYFNDNLLEDNGKENKDDIIDNYFYHMMNDLNTRFENRFFDFTQFSTGLLEGDLDTENELTKQILFLTFFNFIPIGQNINISLGMSESLVNARIKRPMGKVGYFSFGDIPFGGLEKFEMTAYKCNGDIRIPKLMIKKAGLDTVSKQIVNINNLKEGNNYKNNTRSEIENYSIYKMIPPEGYVALGEIIYSSNLEPEKELFCCIKETCAERLKGKDLKFICIYPVDNNRYEGSSFISIWRTPFNTMYSKLSNTNFIDGMSLIENFYLNDSKEVISDLYNKDGSIKQIYITKLEEFLNNIKLPKIVFLTIILSYTVEQTKKDLFILYNKYIKNNSFITSTPNIKILEDPNIDLTYNDISNILMDIKKIIDNYNEKYSEKKLTTIRKEITQHFLGKNPQKVRNILGEPDSEDSVDSMIHTMYRLKSMYESIVNTINALSIKVSNGSSLYDLFTGVYNYGINAKVFQNDLTYTQKLVLNIINVLIPPTVDIWIPANRCLVYEQIDKERLSLEQALTDKLKDYQEIISNFNIDDSEDIENNNNNNNNNNKNNNNKNETEEDKFIRAISKCGADNVKKINLLTERLYEVLEQNLSHIPDYLERIQKGNFKEFTNGQLELIYKQINNLLVYINKKC
jgi:hypothetical protein